MSKIGDFFHGIANDISKVHVRAAFSDVEKRIAHLFGHTPKEESAPRQTPEELSKVKHRAAFADVEHRVNKILDEHGHLLEKDGSSEPEQQAES